MNHVQGEPLMDPACWQSQVFNGEWTAGGAPDHAAIEPATGAVLAQVGVASSACVRAAARQARAAQPAWYQWPYEKRASVFREAARLAETHRAELLRWLVRESGSTRAKASAELDTCIKVLHESAGLPAKSLGEILPSVPGRMSLARRRPIGVVGVIAPFNFPLYLALRAVAPALALGNAVLLKPDLRTAVCGGVAIARLFERAGLPRGVLHVLPGDGQIGAAVVADPEVSMIQFTGSTQAGRHVGAAAGQQLKKVSLELGGKNTLIVLDDADIAIAVSNAAWGSYLHQGQICMATGRILVQRKIYAAFVQQLAAKAGTLRCGNPDTEDVALGPLINAQQRNHVAAVVAAAIQAGATLSAGGDYEGLYFAPTVLSDVAPDNPAFSAEIFGPVAVVLPFDDDAQAVALANQGEYGLSMGVISSDLGRALSLAEQLQAGLVHVNDQTVKDEVLNPFGGVKASGNGASAGGCAHWEEFTQWQWMSVNRQAKPYPI